MTWHCHRDGSNDGSSRDTTTRPNELWHTGFTYLEFIGWGQLCLRAIFADCIRDTIAWKFCSTMKAAGVNDTLDWALENTGCDNATVV